MTERRPPRLSRAACFALAVAALLLLFTHRLAESQNDISRIVAVESLALRGHFYVDDAPEAQRIVEVDGHRFHYLIDMVYNRRDGHFYSSKPPVLTLVLAAAPALLHALGLRFTLTGPGSALPLVLLTWVTIGWASAGAFYAFRRKAGDLIERPTTADLATALTLGGTLFLSYSATINHHTPTAAAILGAFCLLGMAEAGRRVSDGRAALAGFLMGLAAVVDIGPGFVYSVAFGLYILFYLRSLRVLIFFGLGSIPPLALHCAVQYSIWGSVLPVQMIKGTKDYPLSYWHVRIGSDAWRIPRWRYWLLTLFSMRGLFVLSPVLLLGAAGLAADVAEGLRERRDPERAGRAFVALTVLFGIVFLVCYTALATPTNFGGDCYGMRYYVGFMPLLAFYALRAWSRWGGGRAFRMAFCTLGAVSLLYAVLGITYTWTRMDALTHPLIELLKPLRGF